MKSFLTKREVWIFLISIVIANGLFVTAIVEGFLPTKLFNYGRFFLLAAVLFGLIFVSRGFKGCWDVLKPMFVWRLSPWFYVFAVLWTLGLCVVVLTVKSFITAEPIQIEALQIGYEKMSDPMLLFTLLVSSFVGEIVWLSYAVRKLSSQFTLFVSALIVGFVWTLWWLPMSIHNFGIISDLPLMALMFNQMGVALMCAFVYYHSRSGLLVLVMQLAFNTTILIFPVTPDVAGVSTYWAFAITYFLLAVLLHVRFGQGQLFHSSEKVSGLPNQAGMAR